MLKRYIAIVVLAIVPFAAWGMFKPIRVLAPELNGMTCVSATLCLDDSSKKEEALQIYNKSISAIVEILGPFKNNPRAIFCVTDACFSAFGLKAPSVATAVGVSGLVISPQGWNATKVAHEFIHHLQAEKFGVLQMFSKPEWLIEGMAYYLSNDNMDDVPQRYVDSTNQFEAWYLKNDETLSWDLLKSVKK